MQRSNWVINATIYLLFAAVLMLVLVPYMSAAPGERPFGLWYVYSGSMEPVLKPGDGFIVVRSDDLQVGDIIVYKPQKLSYEYVTHRIVQITDEGRFITRGDNSPFTDQQGTEPPVGPSQVNGKVLTFRGHVVVLPYLGLVSATVSRLATTVSLGAKLGLLVFLALFASGLDYLLGNRRSKSRTRPFRLLDIAPYFDPLLLVFLAVLVLTGVGVVQSLGAWTSSDLSYVAVDRPGLRSPMIGTPYSESRTLENTSRLPYYVVIQPDSERVTVDPEVALVEAGERLEYSLSTTAPGETGHYVEPVSIRVYPAFMAEATFRSLYQYHFALPLIVAFSPLLLGLLAVGVWWLWRWRGSQGLVMCAGSHAGHNCLCTCWRKRGSESGRS